jgi:type I restriction enzyme M protein
MVELYSEQDAETKVIVPTLHDLGYVEDHPERDVVVRYRYSIEAQQGRESRTIFADIVVFVNGAPVIVIDAKNPRQYLTDNDRRQVISYARLVGDVAPYSVLCNGRTWQVFDTITKGQLQRLPSYRDLIKDLQRRRLSDRQRKSLKSQATRTLFAIDSARELSRLLRRCHDAIRNLQGYDPTKAFDELSKLLFAKMYEERELSEGRRNMNRFTTEFVRQMREQGVEIIQSLWSETVHSDRYRDVFFGPRCGRVY